LRGALLKRSRNLRETWQAILQERIKNQDCIRTRFALPAVAKAGRAARGLPPSP
jgi:hypothetical protein